jgi:hypothetical protein
MGMPVIASASTSMSTMAVQFLIFVIESTQCFVCFFCMKKFYPEGFDLAEQYIITLLFNIILLCYKKGPEKKIKISTMSQTFLFRKGHKNERKFSL